MSTKHGQSTQTDTIHPVSFTFACKKQGKANRDSPSIPFIDQLHASSTMLY